MALYRQHLDALHQVCRALSDRTDSWDGGLEGDLALSPDLHDALDLLIRGGALDDTVQVGRAQRDWAALSRDSAEVIHLTLPLVDWGVGDHVVYRNLGALIDRGQFLTAAPKTFYLIDEDVIVPPDPPDFRVSNYLQVVALAALLTEQADHEDHAGGRLRLIFLHKVSLALPIVYGTEALAEPIEGLKTLRELLTSSEHREQKRSILKAVLHDLLVGEKEANRFHRLLRHLKELSQTFRERYQLFVCEFDFEEVREELEEKQRDYLGRLNGAFTDLGAKLLSIPAAFYLAVTKMELLPATGSGFEAVVLNSVVTLAVITVSVYMLMLINSQQHTLTATSEEYTSLFARWRERLKFPEQQEGIDRIRAALNRRRRRVCAYLAITTASVLGTLAITLALYLVRLFRWESAIWDALRALKSGVLP